MMFLLKEQKIQLESWQTVQTLHTEINIIIPQMLLNLPDMKPEFWNSPGMFSLSTAFSTSTSKTAPPGNCSLFADDTTLLLSSWLKCLCGV